MILKWLPILIATLIFALGVWEDLRSRKVRNSTVLACAALALATSLVTGGWTAGMQAFLSFGLVATFMIPMFFMRILGGGDVKLMLAASLLMSSAQAFETVLYAFVWGAVLGVAMAITHGSFTHLVMTTFRVASRQTVTNEALHKMPFTVALLFGWLSHLAVGGVL